MSAQPNQVAPLAKSDWIHLFRMELVNHAKTTGTLHVGVAHKWIQDGALPPPASNRWFSDLMKAPYFVTNSAIVHEHKRKYNPRTKLTHLFDLDHIKFLRCMAEDAAAGEAEASTPLTKQMLSDCRSW